MRSVSVRLSALLTARDATLSSHALFREGSHDPLPPTSLFQRLPTRHGIPPTDTKRVLAEYNHFTPSQCEFRALMPSLPW